MRASRVIIGFGVPALAVVGCVKLGGFCCSHAHGVPNGDLTQYGGITAFAGIAFALNTSLAVRWIKEQFLSFFDGMAQRRVARLCKTHADDNAAEMLEERARELKERFCSALAVPSRCYMVLGVAFAALIVALLFTGIPLRFRRYVIFLPFPAVCYYVTAVIHAAFSLLAFDEAASDIDEQRSKTANFSSMLGKSGEGKTRKRK